MLESVEGVSTDQAAIDRLAERALGATASSRARPSGSSTSRRTGRTGSTSRTAPDVRPARTGPATTPRRRSSRNSTGSTRCARTTSSRRPMSSGGDGSRVTQLSTPELGERNVVLFEWLTATCRSSRYRPAERLSHSRRRCRADARPCGSGRGRSRFVASPGTTRPLWGRWATGVAGRTGRASAARSSTCSGGSTRRSGAASRRYGRAPSGSASCTPTSASPISWSTAPVRVIDFDDCGFSWFMYDFATIVLRGSPTGARAEGAWVEATARSLRSTPRTRASSTPS